MQIEKYDQALKTLNYAMDLDSNNIEVINVFGLYYENQKKYQQAREQYSKVINLDPNYASAYYNRCRMNNYLQNQEENCSDCKKAIELGIEDGAFFILNEKKCEK